MCVPYWWCTKHAQLIMGTWPIYKKHFLQLILTKKNFHLIKYLLATFIFVLSFQSVLVGIGERQRDVWIASFKISCMGINKCTKPTGMPMDGMNCTLINFLFLSCIFTCLVECSIVSKADTDKSLRPSDAYMRHEKHGKEGHFLAIYIQ